MSAEARGSSRPISCTLLPDRMPGIPEEQLTDAQRHAVEDIRAGPRGALKGPYVAILRSPGLMAPTQRLGEYIRFHCTLDMRINEMAALMCARHWTQQFEWHAHVPHARAAGLDASVIDAISDGRRPPTMREDETVVFDFLGELFANRSVCDLTYGRARSCFGEEGLMDLLGVAGYYTMLAMIMNVARTAIPEGDPVPLAGLPEQLQTSWPS